MRAALLTGVVLLAANLAAQSPLVTNQTPGNQGNMGGGLYFDLQVHTFVPITQIDTSVGNLGTIPGNLLLEIWLGPSSYVGNLGNPAAWSLAGTALATNYVPSAAYQQVPFTCRFPILLPPGSYGVALRSQNVPPAGTVRWNHAYTNGAGCTSTTIPGSCGNSLHGNAELTLRAGAAQNLFLTGGVFQPRVLAGAIHYGFYSTVAQPYGPGCGNPPLGLLPDLAAPAILGTTARGLLGNCPTPIVLASMGASNAFWNSVPLPLSLAPHGAPGCHLLQSTDLGGWWMPTWFTGPGTAELRFAVPNLPALTGIHVYAQAWGYGPGVNPANLIVSNGLDWTITSQ